MSLVPNGGAVEVLMAGQLFFQKYFSQKEERENSKAAKAGKRKRNADGSDQDSEADVPENIGSDEDSDAEEAEIWKVRWFVFSFRLRF
jgi:hypothetical protein